MANMLLRFALAFAVLLGSAAPGFSGSFSVTVAAGQGVTLRAPGIVRVDTHPADIATAFTDTDSVRIYGVRPGAATLILTTSSSVEARPIQVVAPPVRNLSMVSRAAGCSVPAYVKAADQSHVAVAGPDVALDWTPSSWRLEWTPPDVRVLASSALVTPLQQLGVPVALGLQVEWHDEWQLIAGDGVRVLGYNLPGVGTLAVGDSALGPAGFMDVTVGDARVSAVGIKSQTGQLASGAQAAVNAGPVNVGYATSPAGGSPTIQYHSGSVSASAGTMAGRGLQLGFGVALAPGSTVDSSWTAAGGWRVHVALQISGGAVAEAGATSSGPSVSYTMVGSKAQDPGCFP